MASVTTTAVANLHFDLRDLTVGDSDKDSFYPEAKDTVLLTFLDHHK
jgi:hypothetical protein